MQAMLLAAGLGTRLRPYSLIRPKPLFPVLNRPLLALLLDMLHRENCSRIVVNGHHLWQQVENTLRQEPDVLFQYEPEILGTGGSLRQALPLFSDEPVLVMNGDIYHTVDLSALYAHHRESGNSVTLALHDYPRFNTVAVRDKGVCSFIPGEDVSASQILAFTGIHVVEPEIIERIPPNCFHHIIDLYDTMAKGHDHVGFCRVDGSFWRDIGTPEDYLDLHRELLGGVSVTAGGQPGPAGRWLVSEEARLHSDIELKGWGCIGRAEIGSNVRLENSIVWDDVTIAGGARYTNAIVAGSPEWVTSI